MHVVGCVTVITVELAKCQCWSYFVQPSVPKISLAMYASQRLLAELGISAHYFVLANRYRLYSLNFESLKFESIVVDFTKALLFPRSHNNHLSVVHSCQSLQVDKSNTQLA